MKAKITPAASAVVIAAALWLPSSGVNAAEPNGNVTLVEVPHRGRPVAARADARGTIHLLYDTAEGPQYVRSLDKGKTFSPPIAVVDAAARRPGLQFQGEDLVVGREGRVHVALSTNAWKLKLPQSEWGFYYARLEPGATTFTSVRNINHKPSEGFSLAADDQGKVTACWLSDKLFANVSRDDGKTFGPNVEIDPACDPCNCCTTSAAYGADGKLAILYREETNDERDMYLVLWDQERGQTSQTLISTTRWRINACPMTYFSVARASGGFLAAWPTGEGYPIYFARLDARGHVLPPGEIKTPGKAGHRTGMLALGGADGSTLVAWTKDGQLGWQLYDASGRPRGAPGLAKTSGSRVAGIVDDAGHFILFR